MRGTIEGLGTPLPLADTLPSVLREDAFARGLCSGLDEVLAPVLLSLDDFAAYLDVTTAPRDMLPWLAGWVGISLDESQDPDISRGLLRSASQLHGSRGTRRGIELAVEAALGLPVEVSETGGAAWTAMPGGDLPGEPNPRLTVTVHTPPGRSVDADRVDAVVRSVKPAHVQHQINVVEG